MCDTCGLLMLEACPPARAAREADFDEDLAREQEVQARLARAPGPPPVLDDITALVLRAGLLRPASDATH